MPLIRPRLLTLLAAIGLLVLGLAWLASRPGSAVNVPLATLTGGKAATDDHLQQLQLHDGFGLAFAARGLRGARDLLVLPNGDLLLAQTRQGRISRLQQPATATATVTLLRDGLDMPSGLAWQDGWLYIAETGRVSRSRFDPARDATAGTAEHLLALPPDGNHRTRSLGIGPDGGLYVSIGSSCNACLEDDARRASLLRFDPASGRSEPVAQGLRNSVGFDWSPADGALYATDNGRDWLGDDFPPCELNRIDAGRHYGWPYRNGDNVPDPDFGDALPDGIAPVPPVHGFRAHNAPLGIRFLRHQPAGSVYQHSALVALHGSWNRAQKDGYRVVSLHWQDGRITECPFLTGFEQGGVVIGRPAYITEDGDGHIFISDDLAGAVYRITPRQAVQQLPAGCRTAPAGSAP